MRKLIFIGLIFWYHSLGAGILGIFVSGGYSFPGSPMDFADSWEAGLNYGGGIICTPFSTFGIRAVFDYNEFKLNADKYKESHKQEPSAIIQGGSTIIMSGSLGVKLSPLMPIPFRPYFTAELGGIKKTCEDITIRASTADTLVTGDFEIVPSILAFGGGIEFSYSSFSDVFFEGGYRICFTTISGWTAYAPIRLGVKVKF
jgi:hypothetical protein